MIEKIQLNAPNEGGYRVPAQRDITPEQIELITSELHFFSDREEIAQNKSSYAEYVKLYEAQKGLNLEGEFDRRPKTKKGTDIKDKFFHSIENGPVAQFAELLPLLANKDGRLGNICKAKITRTAKPDDEGNGFVDLVCELSIDRNFIAQNQQLSHVRPSLTFMVDVTSNPEAIEEKNKRLDHYCLEKGKKASVLCFKNSFNVLGAEAPKTVLLENEKLLAHIAEQFRLVMAPTPDGKFVILNETQFDVAFRSFFIDFIDGNLTNVERSIDKLTPMGTQSKDHKSLLDSYCALRDFLRTYKEILATTPV